MSPVANAWTTPRTWVTAEVVTSSLLNTHVRDNLTYLYGPRLHLTGVIDVANTTTETDLVGAVITAGAMGTDRCVRCTILGDYLNNTAAAQDLTLKVKLGSATLYACTRSTSGDATRGGVRITVHLANQGGTAVQVGDVELRIGDETAPTTGTGSFGTPRAFGNEALAAGTVDTTVNQTLGVTITHGVASASLSLRRTYALLEII